MSFNIETVREAWKRAGGRCECERKNCGHIGKCNKELHWDQRGNDNSQYGWEAHHKVSQAAGGADSVSNCEILCCKCHKNTGSYGG